jgi:hypothetical protein
MSKYFSVEEYEQMALNVLSTQIEKAIFDDIKSYYKTRKEKLIFKTELPLKILDKRDKNLALLNLQNNDIYIRYAAQIVLNPKITFEEVL